MSARKIMRIELRNESKQHLMQVTARHGMTQVAALSRVVEWFAGQQPSLQAAILGQYPEALSKEIAALILQNLASGGEPNQSPVSQVV